MQRIHRLETDQLKDQVPEFSVGDTVEVSVKISEGSKTRIQKFQGIVIARKHGGLRETFTVRRTTGTGNIGVERIFPLHSPNLTDIKVLRFGDVKRAKLYYLRQKIGRAARVKEKRLR
ncbi:MAG: 50S ribosomal protein L19 [Candidatus Coatesbacteria bacterium]|nr:50S ribosomal protein L19 [Candidatus Coatesbacteria bacterium]